MKAITRARLKVLSKQMAGHIERLDQIVMEVRDIADGWETGPESSREEMAPALSGGDRSTGRLAAA